MRHWRRAVVIGTLMLVTPAAANAQSLSGVIDKFEYHFDGARTLLFDGSLNFGGETNGVVAKLVMGGSVGGKMGQIQTELGYLHGIGGGFSLEAGIRHETREDGRSTYTVIGFSGEPRKGFAVESYALVSTRGDVFGEFKAVYDQPLSDRVTVQPRLALNLAAQDVADQGIGRGLVAAELGIRLRYAMCGFVAPYVGISHERLMGRTAQITRKAGNVTRSTHVVLGFSSAF
jgi:copper resistance protein B